MAVFDTDLLAGEMVGEYRIIEKIGEGGFGSVYSAVHPVIGKHAAIKVLSRRCSQSPQHLSRFMAEARAVNQIRHRNIIDIFLFGVLGDGRHYFVMELLEGMTLLDYTQERGWLELEEALPLLHGVGRALDAAHAAGIAHRDLKPENVFLTFEDDGTCHPVLLDFGIAKLMDANVGHRTVTGAAIGTPVYMSPEQWRNASVDHRTDIYALGVMTHELLSGQLPFDNDNAVDLMLAHSDEPPPRLSEQANLPLELDAPVAHMLAKDPHDRPASAGDAIAALVDAARACGVDDSALVSLLSITPRQVRHVPSIGSVVATTDPQPEGVTRWLVAVAMLALGVGAASLSANMETPLLAATTAFGAVVQSDEVDAAESATPPLPAPIASAPATAPKEEAKPRRTAQKPRPKPRPRTGHAKPPKKLHVPDDIENPFH